MSAVGGVVREDGRKNPGGTEDGRLGVGPELLTPFPSLPLESVDLPGSLQSINPLWGSPDGCFPAIVDGEEIEDPFGGVGLGPEFLFPFPSWTFGPDDFPKVLQSISPL